MGDNRSTKSNPSSIVHYESMGYRLRDEYKLRKYEKETSIFETLTQNNNLHSQLLLVTLHFAVWKFIFVVSFGSRLLGKRVNLRFSGVK